MATINPYTSPVEAPMMDTYVPIPFQEMMQAGAVTQARYDENTAMQDKFNSELSGLAGADRLEIPGQPGKYIKLNDANAIKELKNEYNKELASLTESIPDKSNPEYRSKLASLYTKFRNDMSPSGRIGIASGNLEKIKAWNKMKADSPQLADDPSLYTPFMNKVMSHANDTKDGSIAPLDLEGTVGDYVDVNKKLVDSLKNLSPEALGKFGIQGTGIDNVYNMLSAEGVDSDRISGVAQMLMSTDPQIANTLSRQAQFKKSRGDKRSIQAIINEDLTDRVGAMSGLFRQNKVKSKIITDQAAMARAKKQELADLESFTFDAVDFRKGTQIPTVNSLDAAKVSGEQGVKAAKDGLALYAQENGLQMGEDGIPVSMISKDGYDVSDVVAKQLNEISIAEDNRNKVFNLEQRLINESGFNPDKYVNTAGWDNAVAKAENVYRQNYIDSDTPAYANVAGLQTNNDPNFKANYIKNEAMDIMASSDPAYKEYKALLKKNAEDGSFQAGVRSMPSDVSKVMSNWFATNYQNLDTSVGGVTSTVTGKEYGSDEFEDVTITTGGETAPAFAGFSFDSNGKPLLRYSLKDEEGKVVDHVKVKAPDSFMDNLVENGYVNQAKVILNQEISSDLGAFGLYNNSQTIDGAQYLSRELKAKYGEDAPKFNLVTKGSRLADGIGLTIPVANGAPKVIPVADKLDAINKITSLMATYHERIVKEQKNK